MAGRSSAGYPKASWSDWTLLRLSGADAAVWLNGQCTQEVVRLPEDEWRQTAFCDERGKVWAFGFVRRGLHEVLLALDVRQAHRFLALAEERIILEDVRVERLDATAALSDGDGRGSALVASIPVGPFFLVFGSQSQAPVALDRAAWEISRGWPSVAEFEQNPLVQELGEDFVTRCVSFTKGCYVGQEVVARVQTRGRVHRWWAVLHLPSEPDPSARVRLPDATETPILRCGPTAEGGWLASTFLRFSDAKAGETVHVICGDHIVRAVVTLPGGSPAA